MSDWAMHRMALERVPFALVITNPNIEDNPIVFVNHAFSRLTGYAPEVAIGRNCRFLQGEDTDPEAIETLRRGLSSREEFAIELLNYKADGQPFLNRIYISPLADEDGGIAYFVGIQRAAGSADGTTLLADGADEALREIHHRVKNHLSMIVSMIRMQARADQVTSAETYATLARRIEALQLLYAEMTTGGTEKASDRDIQLGAYVSRIASAVSYLDGRESVRLNLDLGNLTASIDTAAQVGLIVSEILTNAYQHAFDGRAVGLFEVRLIELSDGTARLSITDDGIGLPEDSRWPDGGNLGGRIVRSLVTGLDAELRVTGGPRGASIVIDIPRERLAGGRAMRERAAAPRREEGAEGRIAAR